MSLFGSRPKSSPPPPKPAPKPTPKPAKPGLFGKKPCLTRGELREALRRAGPTIPGTGGVIYTRREREKMERDIFGKQFGTHITPEEYQRRLKKLREERFGAKTGREKLIKDRQIRFLEKLLRGE